MALIIVLVTVTVTYSTSCSTTTGTGTAGLQVSCNSVTITPDSGGGYDVNLGDNVLFLSVGSDATLTETLPSSTISNITPNGTDIFNGTIAAIPIASNMQFGVVASAKGKNETFTISGTVYASGATTPGFVNWSLDPKITVVAPN
jgi:hypothetical protein